MHSDRRSCKPTLFTIQGRLVLGRTCACVYEPERFEWSDGESSERGGEVGEFGGGEEVRQSVAGGREDLRAVAAADAAGVLAEGDIANPVQIVLDGPATLTSKLQVVRGPVADSVTATGPQQVLTRAATVPVAATGS